ncbi:hypothetical protein G7Y89_g14717 [Cudoniella acicularis]|uniref:Uncharacterized protein n=1 Tax=Cudoniella acicularis TaxID=354080 RepID=A0A8H4QYV3_9HELO|nr:hypothetical protein G7Y89_g14717 [Cudoniella acicularis]
MSISHTLVNRTKSCGYDVILGPALNKSIGSSNILQYYPATARIADVDSTTISAERLARKDSSREQLLRYPIQPQYLDTLWDLILQTIAENPGYHRFQGATIFMHAKNTKLESVDVASDLTTVYERWEHSWSRATDPTSLYASALSLKVVFPPF